MRKKIHLGLISSLLLLLLIGSSKGFGQTYTSRSNGNWNSPGTWTVSNTGGCGNPIPNTPPIANNNRPCPINIIINHNVNLPGSTSIGNNNEVSIQIATNRTLSIRNDLNITGYGNKSVALSGEGTLEIGRDLNLSGNNQTSITGNLNVDIDRRFTMSQASRFVSNGNIRLRAERITINGNGSLSFSALTNSRIETTNQDFTIQNGATILFSGISSIISNRDILIEGYSPNVTLTDNTTLSASRDLKIEGGSNLILQDGSESEIGRDLLMSQQAEISIENQSSLEVLRDVELTNQSSISALQTAIISFLGELGMSNQSTIYMRGSSQLSVEDEVEITTNNQSNGLRFYEESKGEFYDEVVVDGNGSTLYTTGNTILNFEEDVEFEGGADIFLGGQSEVNFKGELVISDHGTTLTISEDTEIFVDQRATLEDGADVYMTDNSNVIFKDDLVFDNTNGTSWNSSNFAEVFIEGDYVKDRNSSLNVNNSGVFQICNGNYPLQSSDSRIIIGPSPAYYGGCRILPVQFLSFDILLQSNQRRSLISWSTAKEWENAYFEIERSIGEINKWEKIGQVSGQGYSDIITDYSFIDDEISVLDKIIYYRIKQVDFYGKTNYTQVKSIQITLPISNTNWTAFPVPSSVGQAIQVLPSNWNENEPISVSISSINGSSETLIFENPEDLHRTLSHRFTEKPRGMYFLNIFWKNQSQQLKIIIK